MYYVLEVLNRNETKVWTEDRSGECNSRVNVILEQYVSQDGNGDKKVCSRMEWNFRGRHLLRGEGQPRPMGELQFRRENG
jgi:hypothetical protein